MLILEVGVRHVREFKKINWNIFYVYKNNNTKYTHNKVILTLWRTVVRIGTTYFNIQRVSHDSKLKHSLFA